MMTRISLSFIILLSTFIGCSSSTDEEINTVTINVSPQKLTFSYENSTKILSVTADTDWGISSAEDWCTVSPSGGIAGTTTINVTVEKNEEYDARSAILTLKSGDYRETYTVTQSYLVEEVIFSDNTFKSYCINTFDTDNDGIFSIQEAATITSLDVSSMGITSLDGIENFTSLQSLNCSNNKLTELDISKLTLLQSLDCSNNQLSELDIQRNINLNSLDCTENSSLINIYVWTGFSATSSFSKPGSAIYVEPEIATPAGYTLVWQDEFNDSRQENGAAVLPNTADWWYETGNGGWGNNEIENYISAVSGSDTCAMIYDGTLKIIAKKAGSEVLSVRMNTSQSWTYGYFEARLKLPGGIGTWPAFWMMPKNYTAWPDDGEIDIMEEVGYNPNWVSSSIHCKAYYHSIGTQKTASTYVSTAESDFHVYAVEWTEDYIKGYVDGESYFEFENDHADNYDTWPFDNPFYLKLNLAWGGNWGGAEGVDESALPATYEIDYVRVFQK